MRLAKEFPKRRRRGNTVRVFVPFQEPPLYFLTAPRREQYDNETFTKFMKVYHGDLYARHTTIRGNNSLDHVSRLMFSRTPRAQDREDLRQRYIDLMILVQRRGFANALLHSAGVYDEAVQKMHHLYRAYMHVDGNAYVPNRVYDMPFAEYVRTKNTYRGKILGKDTSTA